jgi:hypothetical protein
MNDKKSGDRLFKNRTYADDRPFDGENMEICLLLMGKSGGDRTDNSSPRAIAVCLNLGDLGSLANRIVGWL